MSIQQPLRVQLCQRGYVNGTCLDRPDRRPCDACMETEAER